VSRIAKRVAVLACLAAAGCLDTYPVPQTPTNLFYLPSGIAVHPLLHAAGTVHPASVLLVVSTNFDLRYDPQSGGTVLSVDPDAAPDQLSENPEFVPIGNPLRIGSFGGEISLVEPGCPAGWPACRSGCPTMTFPSGVDAFAITSSRYDDVVYAIEVDPSGDLTCGPECTIPLPSQYLDPYGVGIVCSDRAGRNLANAFVTQIRAANNQGLLTRIDLATLGQETVGFDTVALAAPNTYTTAFDPGTGRLFLSTQIGLTEPLRWFNPLTLPAVSLGTLTAPTVNQINLGAYLRATLTQDLAVSNDGQHLYVQLEQVDGDLLQQGVVVPKGGALAVFDLAPDSYNQPSMLLERAVNTCQGGGQLRVLPQRAGKRDLVALTCDTQAILMLYDDEIGDVVSYVWLDPGTGQPLLGRQPFGMAVEPIDPSRAITSPQVPYAPGVSSPYTPSPCTLGNSCVRIYVASFAQSWVNLVELDPASPQQMSLVKRIGIPSSQ